MLQGSLSLSVVLSNLYDELFLRYFSIKFIPDILKQNLCAFLDVPFNLVRIFFFVLTQVKKLLRLHVRMPLTMLIYDRADFYDLII